MSCWPRRERAICLVILVERLQRPPKVVNAAELHESCGHSKSKLNPLSPQKRSRNRKGLLTGSTLRNDTHRPLETRCTRWTIDRKRFKQNSLWESPVTEDSVAFGKRCGALQARGLFAGGARVRLGTRPLVHRRHSSEGSEILRCYNLQRPCRGSSDVHERTVREFED